MAFVGVIRPLVKGNSTLPPDRRPALLLGLGFAISAVATYAALSALGALVLGPARSSRTAWLVAALVLLVLVALDAGLFGLRTPTLRRQTPQTWMYRFGEGTSAFLWGLDAGTVVSTFRFTSLSWAALAVTVLGLVPWWAGAAYALGFVLPELLLNLALPARPKPSETVDPEPVWLMETLFRLRPRLKPLAVAALVATVVLSLAQYRA